MRINPVLKNEIKLSTRSIKFTLVILFYVGILSATGLFVFNQCIKNIYAEGFALQSTIAFYVGMAILQAVLLMFIVPSLTSTAICGEREKQTLDVLLSTKMTPLSIITGKLFASISRVLLLIVCTIPIYSIMFLIGGIDFGNILQLSVLFIVATIFVGSIGVCISTFAKSSRVSTAITYGIVLLIFIVLVIAAVIYMVYAERKLQYNVKIDFPIWAYISPTVGFISLLGNQLGMASIMNAAYYLNNVNLDSFQYGYLISIGFQLIISIILNIISAYVLNPLHKARYKRKK